MKSNSAETAAAWPGATTARENVSAAVAPATRNVALGDAMRSIAPSRILCGELPTSNSANLMLDEPPLMARMREVAGSKDDSFIMPKIRVRPV